MSLVGLTVIRLNLTAMGHEVVPALVRRHLFDTQGHTEYLVAVVSQDESARVVYESTEGAARKALASPDVSTPLFGGRPGPFVVAMAGLGRGPGDRFAGDLFDSQRGERGDFVRTRLLAVTAAPVHWRFLAKHRAGSLESAVAATRTRNLLLSSGILALLTVAVGLTVVSSRRAAMLARQQLELVAAVSHELRTPVSVIKAAADNLADGVVGDRERVKQYGETIQTEARRLGDTVEHVLEMAGIEAGYPVARHDPVNPAALVRDALAAHRHELETRHAAVEVDIAPNLPHVIGDGTALQSALQNLIGNALKYGGATAWLKVAAKPADSGGVRISVEDRGPGIDAADRRHIFDPFYRGREAISRQIQGSGLGLHLARRIVEAHGGSIAVESETGVGSTFTIELPMGPETTVQESPAGTVGTVGTV
jgi:signal transduction histidine kinase